MTATELYDLDFAEWAKTNADLLRSKRFSEIDLEHIAEEIEDLAKRERRSLSNRLFRLIEHLLKWQFQPERRGSSWTLTIMEQRRQIRDILKDNPSFRRALRAFSDRAYKDATKRVSTIINLPSGDFPQACPYSVDQLLDDEFFPG